MSIVRLKELRGLIEFYNKSYYQQNISEISDQEYDILFRELLILEDKYPEEFSLSSPMLKIGTDPVSSFLSCHHKYKMYSLNNAMTHKEFSSFFDLVMNVPLVSLATPSIVLEYKFDGLAVEIFYKDHLLIEASTRGDGETGELITENIRTIRNIPLKLDVGAPKDLVIYGEVVMLKEDFIQLNEKRKEKGEKEFSNPRNAAAGSVRLLNSRESATRKLSFYAYDCRTNDIDSELSLVNLHTHRMEYLRELGFSVSPEYKIIHPGNRHEALEFYNDVNQKRVKLPFEIDGLVAKVVMDEIRTILGYTDRAPKWAIAWKFDAEEAQTLLLKIECEVGRTGVLTPVALLEPVDLSGITISRASLHNFDYIAEHDFRINDTIVVRRAGDVIPFVVRSIIEMRNETSQKFLEPTVCPVCRSETKREKTMMEDNSRALRCSNLSCPGRLKARLRYFVSKQGMDIEGFGSRLVDTLFDHGFLGTKEKEFIDLFSSIYMLDQHREKLIQLEGFGEKKIDQLLSHINLKRSPSLSRFIQAFGIRSVGSVSSLKLAKYFVTFDNFVRAYQSGGSEFECLQKILRLKNPEHSSIREMTKEECLAELESQLIKTSSENTGTVLLFESTKMSPDNQSNIISLKSQEANLISTLVLGVGATEEIVKFFTELQYQHELKELLGVNFTIVEDHPKGNIDLGINLFSGKKILVTGKSQRLSTRKEMNDFIESLGAVSMPAVTGQVDIVIECENPGSEKIKKSLDLGVSIIKEDDFFDQLDPDFLDIFRSHG